MYRSCTALLNPVHGVVVQVHQFPKKSGSGQKKWFVLPIGTLVAKDETEQEG
jgi:hypothetical protein